MEFFKVIAFWYFQCCKMSSLTEINFLKKNLGKSSPLYQNLGMKPTFDTLKWTVRKKCTRKMFTKKSGLILRDTLRRQFQSKGMGKTSNGQKQQNDLGMAARQTLGCLEGHNQTNSPAGNEAYYLGLSPFVSNLLLMLCTCCTPPNARVRESSLWARRAQNMDKWIQDKNDCWLQLARPTLHRPHSYTYYVIFWILGKHMYCRSEDCFPRFLCVCYHLKCTCCQWWHWWRDSNSALHYQTVSQEFTQYFQSLTANNRLLICQLFSE